jgi:hypothetical protein
MMNADIEVFIRFILCEMQKTGMTVLENIIDQFLQNPEHR